MLQQIGIQFFVRCYSSHLDAEQKTKSQRYQSSERAVSAKRSFRYLGAFAICEVSSSTKSSRSGMAAISVREEEIKKAFGTPKCIPAKTPCIQWSGIPWILGFHLSAHSAVPWPRLLFEKAPTSAALSHRTFVLVLGVVLTNVQRAYKPSANVSINQRPFIYQRCLFLHREHGKRHQTGILTTPHLSAPSRKTDWATERKVS